MWEGGSAATGYLDEYSDLDIALITTDDTVEEIAFVKDLNDLKEKFPKAIKRYKDLIEELGEKYR